MPVHDAVRFGEGCKRLLQPSAAEEAAETLAAEVVRLRYVIANGDFKDVYAEGLELGKRFGAPALGRVEQRIHMEHDDSLIAVGEIRRVLCGGAL